MKCVNILLLLIGFIAVSAERDVQEKQVWNKNGRFFNPDNLPPEQEKKTDFWINKTQDRIGQLIRSDPQKRMAKNIILLIGDGMSISTLMAARTFKGQQKGLTGEEESLSFEKFPFTGLAKTYCTNSQIPESSCASTALHCGVKANIFTVGVNAEVPFDNCPAGNNAINHVESIASWAQKARKSTGFVTTSRVTHSTPAGLYAHSSNRFWESDLNVQEWNQNPQFCPDIASQLIRNEPGNKFNVILGGGSSKFFPNTVQDGRGNFGERLDGINLIDVWKMNHTQGKYITNPFELNTLDVTTTTDVLGLFQPGHFDYNNGALLNEQPSLSEMAEKAIEILEKNKRGYFLMIEGALIDSAHHETRARVALEETIEFDKAVESVVRMTNVRDTLIIVTSDHGHSMSVTGFPKRGNNILDVNENILAADLEPYTVLSYANGPNQYLDETGKRLDITQSIDPLFNYPSYVPMESSSHGGEDVSVYARGPYAHYFSGNYEQNDIPHLMAFTACIGEGRTHCRKGGR